MRKLITQAAIALLASASILIAATEFSGNLLLRPAWTHKKTNATTTSEAFPQLFNWDFTNGGSTNQMDQLWHSQRSLTNGANEVIDITGGITNAFGDVLTMSEVRMMIISMTAAQSNTVVIGGATNNAFASWLGDPSDTVILRPGGIFLLVGPDAPGYAVSTNSNLKIPNGGTNTVTYDIYLGASSN